MSLSRRQFCAVVSFGLATAGTTILAGNPKGSSYRVEVVVRGSPQTKHHRHGVVRLERSTATTARVQVKVKGDGTLHLYNLRDSVRR